jgi:ubiquinone biosynthesis protein
MRHRARLDEIAGVLAKYGFAAWVQRGSGLVSARILQGLVDRHVDAEIVAMSDGERLRRALTELGTAWVKFGQMLSLRPDVVGEDVAEELKKLQATVAPDHPGVAQALVERELGAAVSDAFGSFDAEPMASGSVAEVHRATLHDGTAVAVKVLHDGVEHRVLADLELMAAIAAYLETEDPGIAQLRPTVIVAEFSQMLHDAIDLSQELQNLQRFTVNFADEPDIVFPTPYPELSRRRVLTMSLVSGAQFGDRAAVEATGWDVDVLVRRAADAYLEMIFRHSLYHADPQPGNLLIPDGTHIAILDFGDVGRISSTRRRQLEDLVIAAGTNDVDGFIDVIVEITTPPATVDMNKLRSQIDVWMNRYLLIGVGHLDMTAIMRTGMQLLHANGLVMPADLSTLFRAMLQLQGLGRELGTEVRVTELLQPYMKHLLAERFDPRRLARHAGRTIRSWDRLATSLPGDIEEIVQQIRAGRLSIDFRVHDAGGAVDNLVDGLVAAASVLGSAQLFSRRTGPIVAGISLPGVVAAGVGVLTWQRLVRRRRERKTWVSRAREVAESRRHDRDAS